jgi:hypothetical protein
MTIDPETALLTVSTPGARCQNDSCVIRPSNSGPIRPVARNFPPAPPESISYAHERVQKKVRSIRRLVAQGRIPAAQKKAGKLFFSIHGRLVAAAQALKKHRVRPGQQKPRPSQLARYLFDETACDVVYVKAVEKGADRYRPICDFGLVDKARQHLVALAFGPLASYAEQQFGVAGRGIKQAVEHTHKLVEDSRFKFAVELDISNCFGSVDPNLVQERYGLPDWVMDYIVTNKGKEDRDKLRPRNALSRNKWHHIASQIGYLLPQGSPASPIFAYGLLKGPLEKFRARFEDRVVVVVYCDNFLILAHGQESLEAAKSYLIDLLTAEQFVLKQKSGVKRLSDGINFLGHRFRRHEGHQIVDLPIETKRSFARGLKERLAEMARPSGNVVCDHQIRLDDFVRWTRGKLGSFAHAPDAQLEAMRVTLEQIEPLTTEPMIARLIAWMAVRAPSQEVMKANTYRVQTRSRLRWREPWRYYKPPEPNAEEIRASALGFVRSLLRGGLHWLPRANIYGT